MISATTIWAIVLRHMRMWRRDWNLVLDSFYWPLLDILSWGFLIVWIQQSLTSTYEATALLGVLLWQVIGRGCNIIALSFLEELWSHNVVNLFSLPLRLTEWMIGVLLLTLISMGITFTFSMAVIYFVCNVSLWSLFSTFLIFFPPMLFSCLWLGLTCLQILITFGKRGAQIGFMAGWFFLPFSGAYYPVEILPTWAQKISSLLPMSYVFQGMRAYTMHQQAPTPYLFKGYVLSILYALCALLLFIYFFNRSKEKGLAQLTN